MSDSGWISIHRKIIEWEWYHDSVMLHVFIHCLLSANHTEKRWRGISIKRGQFVSSQESIAEKTGLTRQQVRTAIKRLKSTSELTSETSNLYSLFTMVNYDEYQPANQPANQRLTSDQPATNQRLTTNNNDNNENNDNNHILRAHEAFRKIKKYPQAHEFARITQFCHQYGHETVINAICVCGDYGLDNINALRKVLIGEWPKKEKRQRGVITDMELNEDLIA